MTIQQIVAHRIQRAAERRNISRAELAKRMKCNPSFITKLYSGKENLCLSTIEKASKAIGVFVQIQIQEAGAGE